MTAWPAGVTHTHTHTHSLSLLCSGCVTSAESVLISQQSQEELYRVADENQKLEQVFPVCVCVCVCVCVRERERE